MSPIIIDVVVGVILVLSTIIATMRGFVREMLTILGLIGSIVATWFWGSSFKMFYIGQLTKWAESRLEEPTKEALTHLNIFGFDLPIDILSIAASYGSVFIFVFIMLALLNLYVSSLVQDSNLSMVDRSLGAVFGVARGVILVVLLYMPISLFLDDDGEKPTWLAEAKSVPLLEYTVDFVKENILPIKENSEESGIVSSIKDVVEKTSEKAIVGYEGIERKALDTLIEKEMKKDDK